MIKKGCAFTKIFVFHQFLPGSYNLLLSSHFWCHPHRLTFDEQTDIPKSVLFPNQVPIELLPTVFLTTTLRVGVRADFVQEVPLDLQCLTLISGHLYRGRRIHTSGHSDFGILSTLGACSKFTWVYADTASAACPSQSGNLAKTSITFSAVIWDADEPCSVKNCVGSTVVFYNVTTEHDSASVLL